MPDVIAKSHEQCTSTTTHTKMLSESKDADNKTMVHIVNHLSYIYFNSNKVQTKNQEKYVLE